MNDADTDYGAHDCLQKESLPLDPVTVPRGEVYRLERVLKTLENIRTGDAVTAMSIMQAAKDVRALIAKYTNPAPVSGWVPVSPDTLPCAEDLDERGEVWGFSPDIGVDVVPGAQLTEWGYTHWQHHKSPTPPVEPQDGE